MIEAPNHIAVIGLGGNVGGDDAIRTRFVRAREAFAEYGHVWSAALYRTAAIGPVQPSFLNTAIGVRIDDGTPDELLAIVLEIERLLGRDRRGEARWGPRPIDLDILVWGARTIRRPDLEVPHPRIAERRFALRPLIDLLGWPVTLPGSRDSIGELEQRVATQLCELVSSSW